MVITKAQRKALHKIYLRLDTKQRFKLTYRQFRKTAAPAFGDCVMVPYAGMVLGIEADGYTHS